MREKTLSDVERRIMAASTRYGPFSSTHEAIGVCMEEWDELREAVRTNVPNLIREEALDLAAACLRLAESFEHRPFLERSGK